MRQRVSEHVRSLRGKVLLAILLPGGLALIVGVWLAFDGYDRVARGLVERRTAELAERTAAWLGEDLRATGQTLQRVAAHSAVRSLNPARMTATFNDERTLRSLFDGGLAVYTIGGERVWAQRPEVVQAALTQLDLNQRLDRIGRTRRVAFSDTLQTTQTDMPFVAAMAPIFDTDGAVRGALIGLANLQTSMIGATLAKILEIDEGSSTFAYLVDGDGRVLYHRDLTKLGRNYADMTSVERVLHGNQGALISPYPDGERVLSGYAPVPGTDWGVVTHQPWRAVVGPLQSYGNTLLGLLAIGGGLVVALVVVVLHRILRPLRALTDGTERVAAGEFDHRIAVETHDELGTLAARFNEMTSALRASYEHLEAQVAERTRQLRASEARFRQLYEDAPLAYFSVDHDGVIRMANPRASELLGYDRASLMGRSVFDLYAECPQGRDKARACFAKLQAQGELNDEELRMERADGEPLWISLSVRPVRGDDRTVLEYRSMFTDITARKRAEAAAERAAALEERARLARDLHDSAAQSLYSVTLMGEAARRRLVEDGDGEQAAHHLYHMNRSAQQALKELRLIVHELRSSPLARGGVTQALADRLQAVEERVGIETRWEIEPDLKLPGDLEVELYYIAQEALNNALKHAEATRVRIRLERQHGTVVLEIADDGCGFDPDGKRGVGLGSMAERAAQWDGRLHVDAAPGVGTTVRAELPLDAADADADVATERVA